MGVAEQSRAAILPPDPSLRHAQAHGSLTALFLEQHQPRWCLSYQGKEEPRHEHTGAGEAGAAGAAAPGRPRCQQPGKATHSVCSW